MKELSKPVSPDPSPRAPRAKVFGAVSRPEPVKDYVSAFLSLKCAGDVLNCAGPLVNPRREIKEAMAIARDVKKDILANRGAFTIIEPLAHNALTSILLAHLLPVRAAFAVGSRTCFQSRPRGFGYVDVDLGTSGGREKFSRVADEFEAPLLLVVPHVGARLAEALVDLYVKTPQIVGLSMIPSQPNVPEVGQVAGGGETKRRLGRFAVWAMSLARTAGGDVVFDARLENINLVYDKESMVLEGVERGGDPGSILITARK